MSVTAVNGQTANIGLTHTGGLTPDGLVLYLQSQLGDIDAKIDGFMAKQKLIQAQRKELNAIATVLSGVEVPVEKDGKFVASNMDSADKETLQEAWGTLQSDLPLDKKTMKLIDDAARTKFDSPEELKKFQSAIDNAIKDLESSASLDMIQLQSCVSQRNTAISLATNLMSAVGKGEESIAGNIGR